MFADFLKERFFSWGDKLALACDKTYSYTQLLALIDYFEKNLPIKDSVVLLKADYAIDSIALLLALIQKRCIIIPFAPSSWPQEESYIEIAQPECLMRFEGGKAIVHPLFQRNSHLSIRRLKKQKKPGLILFSSGSSGKPKAILHDFSLILEKFKHRKSPSKLLSFLLFDHIGGINTLFHSLSTGGLLAIPENRQPATIAKLIQDHKIETLPTSPTFLRLFLMSDAREFDLSSLKMITYGTEPMPESLLAQLCKAFPNIIFKQTYGLSEIGILPTKSESNDSLRIKLGSEARIQEGMLEIKADSAMIGYLNAPSPFVNERWFKTGDLVEADGEWIKILGRDSDIINIGGEKVFPAEIENILLTVENIEDAIVSSEANPVLGNIIKALIKIKSSESPESLRRRIRNHCKGKLARFKIPQKIIIADDLNYSERFKKKRTNV